MKRTNTTPRALASPPRSVLDTAQPLDRDHFEKIRVTEFRPHYDLQGLKNLRLMAQRERDLRELYRGRAPYELLQNADDAGAKKVAFISSNEGLTFVHDGRWFTVANFRNLADGWSDKDPKQCIGHKGLGFRSVLDITPAPYVVKVDPQEFFAVKFTWQLNNGHIQEAFRRDSSLRAYYEDWTKHGQLCCPVMCIPGPAKKQNLGMGSGIYDGLVRGNYGDIFTTMFWLPATDPDTDQKVMGELSPMPIISDEQGRNALLEFLKKEAGVLLPFLASVEKIAVYDGDRCIGLARISKGAERRGEGELTVYSDIGGRPETVSFFQMQFEFRVPPDIARKPDTPKALRQMDKVGVTLSVRLKEGKPVHDVNSRFHVYFPTGEPTGLGFTVHADFYVYPDRTRLMRGDYNRWLLDQAARRAANEFLTQLLDRYAGRSVFTALSPTDTASGDAAGNLVDSFSRALQERKVPFIPTRAGRLKREEVILPPTVDESGFWEDHFSGVVGDALEGKRGFLAHEEDGHRTRAFMRLAGVQEISPESLLDFIERATQQARPAEWWHECYSYMEADRTLSPLDRSFFVGRRLIPLSDSSVISVPDDRGVVVCLPPGGTAPDLAVPSSFRDVFVFLDAQLAQILREREDRVGSWVINRFGIARFEATDLLPRAIRRVAPQLFRGDSRTTASALREAWSFTKKTIDVSRTILSSEFWQDVGRFPLPLAGVAADGALNPTDLVPAFLTYWPDSFIEGENCLAGVGGLRRIDDRFLSRLVGGDEAWRKGWADLFAKVGVSSAPKLLKYSRVIGQAKDLPFVSGAPTAFEREGFCGERQLDENQAVVDTLKDDNLWNATVEHAPPCDHTSSKVLQSLTLVEGLSTCAQLAEQESQSGDESWRRRLWALVKRLPITSLVEGEEDRAFCHGGRTHSITVGRYLQRQLGSRRWLPSSLGPASSAQCFLRLYSRRLISPGATDEELGDKLLPYVAADNLDDLARLQGLGVELLDDAASASPPALVKALSVLGERLSTQWGRNEILEVRGRWRLVRGAIQEIYASLNRSQTTVGPLRDVKFATRSADGVGFQSLPLYYAEPGSAVEKAFGKILPLLDADRPHPRLFEQIGVTRLAPGQTVEETFLAEDGSVPAATLRDEIVNSLGPFLLAPIIAKSDRPKAADTLVRRLQDRFEVKEADNLNVSFRLKSEPSVQQAIEFHRFYLRRRLVQLSGAVQEAHHTLYVAKGSPLSLLDLNLDADLLGATLAGVIADEISEELAALFPRIASRYQNLHGDNEAMKQFMLFQLGISEDAQGLAKAKICGDVPSPPIAVSPLPVVKPASELTIDKQAVEQTIRRHQEELSAQVSVLVQSVTPSTPTGGGTGLPTARADHITEEQKARGRRGEDEILRRLKLRGGWGGLTLAEDRRDLDCGYDFLCVMAGREVRIEVKTFTENGRVIVTSLELREAAASKDDYYLIGLLDDGKPQNQWQSFVVPNPTAILLTKGEFDIQARLSARATDVFDLRDLSQELPRRG